MIPVSLKFDVFTSMKGERFLLVRRTRERIPEKDAQSARLLFHRPANSIFEPAHSECIIWLVTIRFAEDDGFAFRGVTPALGSKSGAGFDPGSRKWRVGTPAATKS